MLPAPKDWQMISRLGSALVVLCLAAACDGGGSGEGTADASDPASAPDASARDASARDASAPDASASDASATDPSDAAPPHPDAGPTPGCEEGTQESRPRFERGEVPFGEVCRSEQQLRRCENGVFGAWDGTFTFEACVVLEPATCD